MGLGLLCSMISLRQRHPHNLLLLGGFTFFQAYVVGAAAAIYAAQEQRTLIACSVGETMVIFGGLSAYVHATERDLTFLEGGLGVGLAVLLATGLVLAYLPYSHAWHVLLSAAGVVVFSGCIVYDTSVMVHHMTPDDAVAAAVQLYLDVLNLFLCALTSSSD